MHRYHHLTDGILRPEDVKVLQQIFDHVVAQPWFDINGYSHEAFAARLFRLFRAGTTDFEKLQELALLTAAADFSKATVAERRQARQLLYQAEQETSTTECQNISDDVSR